MIDFHIRRPLCVLAAVLCISVVASPALPEGGAVQTSLVHAGPTATFTVTADGLSSIQVGATKVAAGGWYAWNAGPVMFNLGKASKAGVYGGYYVREASAAAAKQVKQKSLRVVGPACAEVRHESDDLACTFTYDFDGDDVRISARLENRTERDEVAVPAFGGLRFQFARPPQGLMMNWHPSYLHRIGLEAMHPSHPNRVGGSYASDGQIGIGTSPADPAGYPRTLFLWDFDDWNPGRRESVPVRWLTYLRGEAVPPGGAATFRMTLRAGSSGEWKHLLAPYKAHFLQTYGPVRYAADHRALAVAYVNHSPGAIKPDNPYGLHGDSRRLDRPEMTQKFADIVIAGLKKAGGQGVIIWGQTGEIGRGEMYRTDFDVLPPEIRTQWKDVLARRFSEAGFGLGATARPGEVTYRLDWQRDGTMHLAPTPGQIQMMQRRFDNLIQLGTSLFYLDSFGSNPQDVPIMMALREKMGRNVQTFCEHQCDAIVPFSGIYTETDFWAKDSAAWAKEDQYAPRSGAWFIQFCRWMLGEDSVNVISRLYDVHGKIPDGFEPVHRFFLRNHITPMLPDYLIGQHAEQVRQLQQEYLSPDGKKWVK